MKGAPGLDEWMGYSERRRKLIMADVERRIDQHNALFDDD